jgi:5'-deoxynucleotidase YfbR-like HD superfamily hydrolase
MHDKLDLSYVLKMRNVNRLGTVAIKRHYNLLEHSYIVSVLFIHFANEERIPYDTTTMEYILFHDTLEVITGDMPYTVKNHNETTKLCWMRMEQEMIQNHPQLAPYTDRNMEKYMTKQQMDLFKVCDLLDLWIFLKEEEALGNKSNQCIEIVNRCVTIIGGRFKSVDDYMKNYIYI